MCIPGNGNGHISSYCGASLTLMMIRSIIFIRVLFADLLFKLCRTGISLMRGGSWGGGAGEHYPEGVTIMIWGVSDMWHPLSEHRVCCDHAEADTRGHRIRMLDQLVSYNTSADRDTGNVDTMRRVSPVLFWAHTGRHLRPEQHRVCHNDMYTGCRVESVPPAPSSDSGWPGLAGDTGLAPCWLQSRAGFRPGHIQHQMWSVTRVINKQWIGCYM